MNLLINPKNASISYRRQVQGGTVYCKTKVKEIASFIMTTIETFVFLDLETTGLPCFEQNRTKITELCLMAVQKEHLKLGIVPRVQNKLNLCFNPNKLISVEAERMTGLSNEKLERLSPFSVKTVDSINLFLEHNPKPICFVAHNGNKFDFPILRAEIEKTGANLLEDVYCVDTLQLFRCIEEAEPVVKVPKTDESIPLELCDGYDELLCQVVDEYEKTTDISLQANTTAMKIQKINETTPKRQIISTDKKSKPRESRKRLNFGRSFKLGDVYRRLTSSEPVDCHQAEGDVNMLITCAAVLGDSFVDQCNVLCKKFCDIPSMVPGKRVGP